MTPLNQPIAESAISDPKPSTSLVVHLSPPIRWSEVLHQWGVEKPYLQQLLDLETAHHALSDAVTLAGLRGQTVSELSDLIGCLKTAGGVGRDSA